MKELWFLENDGILFPLDRNYRIGRHDQIVLPEPLKNPLNVNLEDIEGRLRFATYLVKDNYGVVYAPDYEPPFDFPIIKSFFHNQYVKIKPKNPLQGKTKIVASEYLLGEGDEIIASLVPEKTDDGPVDRIFKVRLKNIEKEDERMKALLVGVDSKYRTDEKIYAEENNIHAMRGTLLTRGFPAENITELMHDNATKKNITEKLEEMVSKTSSFDTTLFYFGGHGNESNLTLYANEAFTPNDFYQHFNHIQGNKIIIIDACHAAGFYGGAKDALFLGSSTYELGSQAHETAGSIYLGAFTKLLLQSINKEGLTDLANLDEQYFNEELSKRIGEEQKVFFRHPRCTI